MLVIKVEIWPHGDESRKRDLGTAHVINDGTGTIQSGNYQVKLFKGELYSSTPGIWKESRVEGFPRLRLGPWDLLFRGLRAAVSSRNPA